MKMITTLQNGKCLNYHAMSSKKKKDSKFCEKLCEEDIKQPFQGSITGKEQTGTENSLLIAELK